MAGNLYLARSSKIALAGTVKKTLIQVQAPNNVRVRVLGWGIFFDGVAPTNTPVEVWLQRNDTAGTMDAVSGTASPLGIYDEARQSNVYYSATAEPVYGDIVDALLVHPQQGADIKFPFGQEIFIPGGGRLAIACTSTAVVNAVAKILFEE